MVPTAPAAYTIAEIEADPVRLNSNLGTYTNFVNLLDLAGLAVPAVFARDGTPFGVTFLAPAGRMHGSPSIGRAFHAGDRRCRSARCDAPHAAARAVSAGADAGRDRDRGGGRASLRHAAQRRAAPAQCALPRDDQRRRPTIGCSRLPDTKPPKPGLLGVALGTGSAIEVEMWALEL